MDKLQEVYIACLAGMKVAISGIIANRYGEKKNYYVGELEAYKHILSSMGFTNDNVKEIEDNLWKELENK